jgi:predicted component of type VI protein secretion system
MKSFPSGIGFVGGFSLFKIMSAELQDVIATSTPSSGTPGGDIASSGNGGEQATASSNVTTQPEGTTNQEGASASPPIPEYLQGIPTVEELTQQKEQKVPLAAGLLNLRTALETLQPQYDQLNQKYEPWASVLERYQTPDEFKADFETGRGLFTETEQVDQNGLPIRTAMPGLQKLAETNESDFLQMVDEALKGFTYENEPLLNRYIRQAGLDPGKLEQYREWEKEPPQSLSPEDLSRIPTEFKEAFDKLPAYIQKERLLMDDEALKWQLERDHRDYEGNKQAELSQQRQQQEIQQSVVRNVETTTSARFESGFNEIVKDLAPVAFTPNPTVNSILQQSLAHMMVNVAFDPAMDFTHGSIKSVVEQLDPEIRGLRETVHKQTEAAERYKEYQSRTRDARYSREQADAERMAENAALKLQAKVSGLTSTFVKFLSGQLSEAQGAEEAASLNGRPLVSGQATGIIASNGANSDWHKSFIRS